MKNKLILFDWGNVVESHNTGYSCKDAWQDLFRICGYQGDKQIFNNMEKYHLSDVSNIKDYEKEYEEFAKEFSLHTSFKEFENLYYEVFDKVDYYKDVVEYEKSLKDKCYIGILSNLNMFEKVRLDKQVHLDDYDYVFLSFEMGVKKPSMDIYEQVLDKVPFKPEDILFIDDLEENVTSAKALGWNAYKLTGLELDTIKEVVNNFLNN